MASSSPPVAKMELGSQSAEVNSGGKEQENEESKILSDENKSTQQPLKCQFCSEEVLGIFKLNKHLKKVHNARISITCNLCGERFKRNKEFKLHLLSHQSTRSRGPVGRRNGISVKESMKKNDTSKAKVSQTRRGRGTKDFNQTEDGSGKKSEKNNDSNDGKVRREDKNPKKTDSTKEKVIRKKKSPGKSGLTKEKVSRKKKSPGKNDCTETEIGGEKCENKSPEKADTTEVDISYEKKSPEKDDSTAAEVNSVRKSLRKNGVTKAEISSKTKSSRKIVSSKRKVGSRKRRGRTNKSKRTKNNRKISANKKIQSLEAFPADAEIPEEPTPADSAESKLGEEGEVNEVSITSGPHNYNWDDWNNDLPPSPSMDEEEHIEILYEGVAPDPLARDPLAQDDPFPVITKVESKVIPQPDFVHKEYRPSRKRTRKQELEIKSEYYRFACQKCNLALKTPELIRIHASFHTLKVNARFQCSLCRKFQKTLGEYKVHQATACGSRALKPTQQVFKPKSVSSEFFKPKLSPNPVLTSQLSPSSVSKPKNQFVKLYPCLKCGKKFINNVFLQAHLSLHSQDPAVASIQNSPLTATLQLLIPTPTPVAIIPARIPIPRLIAPKASQEVPKKDVKKPIEVIEIDKNPLTVASNTNPTVLKYQKSNPSVSTTVPKTLAQVSSAPDPSTNRRKAGRKETPSSVMYQDFGQEEICLTTSSVPELTIPNQSTKRRKAGRKEPTSSVMYKDFAEDAIFLTTATVPAEKPKSPFKISCVTNYGLYLSEDGKSYTCEKCHKDLPDLEAFKQHLKNHARRKRFPCTECGQKCKTLQEFQYHMRAHEGFIPFQCQQCEKSFSSHSSLRRHRQLRHDSSEKMFPCTKCSNRYSNNYQLRSHMAYHKRQSQRAGTRTTYTCETCGAQFSTWAIYNIHLNRHTGVGPYLCPYCDLSFVQKASVAHHIKTTCAKSPRDETENSIVTCDICGNSMSSAAFPLHMKKHATGFERPFSCPECVKTFRTRTAVNRHVLTLHPHIAGHICSLCWEEFPSKELLIEHKNDHPPIIKPKYYKKKRPCICEVCGKTLSSPHGLIVHMQRHSDKKNFQCDTCGKLCKTKGDLRLHSFVHASAKNFSCKYCDYCAKSPADVYIHVLYQHYGRNGLGFQENDKFNQPKNFFCEICDEGFIKEQSLNQHRIYHDEFNRVIKCKHPDCTETFFTTFDRAHHKRMKHDPDFQCPDCDQVFRYKPLYYAHRRYKHTGESPYKCHLCDRAFKVRSDLKYHIAIHTGDYKFNCEFCDKKFITRGNMNAHLRTHNGYKCLKCGIACGSAKAWKTHQCQGQQVFMDLEVQGEVEIEIIGVETEVGTEVDEAVKNIIGL